MQRPQNRDSDDEQNYFDDLSPYNFENQLINDGQRMCINMFNSEMPIRSKCVHSKGHAGSEIDKNQVDDGQSNFLLNDDELNNDSRLEEVSLSVVSELQHIAGRIQFLSQHKKNQDSYQQVCK